MKRTLFGLLLLAIVSCTSGERRLAPEAGRGDADRGKELMVVNQCYDCHIIPGIDRKPGPGVPTPLAGLAFREKIVMKQVANTRDNLEAYIQHPRKHFALTAMPGIGDKPQDARDIAAYLVTLD